MNSFRDFVRKHISRNSLLVLVALGIGSLHLLGQSFVENVGSTFAEIDYNIAPSLVANVRLSDPNRLPTTTPPSTEVPDRSLAKGESSREVLLLQEFLKWRGFWPEPEVPSGYFGDITVESVKKYQEIMKIEPEGIVGPQTREAWKQDIEKRI